MKEYIKVEVFIPEENLVELVNALNEKSILRDGRYDYVFATSHVTGHFRPIEGANPHIGEVGVVSEVKEVKVEFRIRATDMESVKDIIVKHHPYEEPVVNYIELL
ncbi:hypothetical protein [Peptoniphilus asaccharolyticus]